MDAEVRDNQEAGRFELERDGHVAAAEYRLRGRTITFTHTYVPPELRGRGVGTLLVEAALESARSRGLSVVPACSFFAAYMKKHPDTHDLLAEGVSL